MDFNAMESAPSAIHWFGTDSVGRDLYVRTMRGTSVSLMVALLSTMISLAIGVLWGTLSGYLGGRVDEVMMRVVDILYSLPFILVVVLLTVVFGPNLYLLFAALGAIYWLDMARIVRGQTLRLKAAPFISAAKIQGATTLNIIAVHILPNIRSPIIIYGTITIPAIILAESFISFIGLGVQEPQTSLGVLISDGIPAMETSPWLLMFPSVCLVLIIWSLNTLGDELRDQLDPKTERQ
ncbi:ABC transporter permease subunit [Gammaproteobacteria bacterium]|nr:ABC transporter permease subunit [Gammaproteobacteria bacterium]